MKTTKWFPVTVNPARKGIYQITNKFGNLFWAFWNGKYWGNVCVGFEAALDLKREKSDFMYEPTQVKWRGLAQEPKQ